MSRRVEFNQRLSVAVFWPSLHQGDYRVPNTAELGHSRTYWQLVWNSPFRTAVGYCKSLYMATNLILVFFLADFVAMSDFFSTIIIIY